MSSINRRGNKVMRKLTIHFTLCWAALAVGTLAQAAPTSSLPLQPGTYVISSYKPCEEAPLAGVKTFDGKALIGPHESDCTSSIVSHRGETYQISTECRAHGDGTPQSPSKSLETVQVKSKSSLAVVVHGQPVRYDLCPIFTDQAIHGLPPSHGPQPGTSDIENATLCALPAAAAMLARLW
jgi:hypothetical protein